MRRLLALLIALMLAALPAAGLQTPAATHAAPAQTGRIILTGRLFILTGRLVATSQITTASAFAPLLLQVGARTFLVGVTNRTQLVSRNFAPISLSDLHNGDILQVTGRFRGVMFMALRIRDLSLPVPLAIQVKGLLAAPPSPATMPPSGFLCLANTVITGVGVPRALALAASPCPAGQLPIFLTANTKIQDQFGNAISLADLRAGDTLQVTASLVNGQLIAAVVTDLALPVPPILQVKGQLAAAPSPATIPPSGLLCLANAVIAGVSVQRALALAASPCPAGQLPVFLTGSTKIQDRVGNAISLANLAAGDTLQVTASLVNSQLVASLVTDLFFQIGLTTLTGTLVATPQVTTSVPAVLLLQVGAQTMLLGVTSQTQLVNSTFAPITLGDLHDGAQLRLMGSSNGVVFTTVLIQDLSL